MSALCSEQYISRLIVSALCSEHYISRLIVLVNHARDSKSHCIVLSFFHFLESCSMCQQAHGAVPNGSELCTLLSGIVSLCS